MRWRCHLLDYWVIARTGFDHCSTWSGRIQNRPEPQWSRLPETSAPVCTSPQCCFWTHSLSQLLWSSCPPKIQFQLLQYNTKAMVHCTFTMYWPRVYSIIEWWSQQKRQRATTPGQLIELQAINALWDTISGEVVRSLLLWIRSQLSVVMPFTK